jgi:hypothetical protein
VAVVDGGVAYDAPDLAPAVWANPGEAGGGRERNGVDDDRNGFVDDHRGWDFRDDDADPRDLGLLPHGTAVAGIVGARADDGVGIAGVAPLSRVMPLRVTGPDGAGTVSDVVAAFGYAATMGARVVNASFGGPVASNAERETIAAAPGVLFVVSAGNEGADLDGAAASYPCEFDLPNVICVAATDERDELPAFSNRGARVVDLAAPGVGVLTAAPPFAVLLAEGAETPLDGRWSTGGGRGAWTRAAARAWSGDWSLVDAAAPVTGDDADDGSWIRSRAPLDLRGRTGCRLDLQVRGGTGTLAVETSTDGGDSWTQRTTLRTGAPEWTPADADLTAVAGRSAVLVGLRSRPGGGGVEVDDLAVRCLGGAPGGRDLLYASGTSFSAPVVSGIAALLVGARPSSTVAELRSALLAGVDPMPSLAGRVATGGRASARRALDALLPPAAVIVADAGRVARLQVRRAAATRRVTLRVTLAAPAATATGLLFRRATLVRRVTVARGGTSLVALGRLAPGAYRLTLAPPGAAAGARTVAFTVPARRPARRGTHAAHESGAVSVASTGATGYHLPATPRPFDPAGLEPAPGTVPGDPVAARIGGGLARLLADRALPAGAAERRLRALAAAAGAGGTARLRPGGATAAAFPLPRRIRGSSALARALDAPIERLRAATAAGDLAGVRQALRDAALLAPALGDAVARRASARRATARGRAERRLATGLRRFATLG